MLLRSGSRAGYFDWAIDLPLPNGDRTILEGGKLISRVPTDMRLMCAHSQEGRVGMSAALRDACGRWAQLGTTAREEVRQALYRLHWEWNNPSRPTTAWHTTTLQFVTAMIQHAPLTARLAHGHAANPNGPGHEAEGIFTEPLMAGQKTCWYRMLQDVQPAYGVFKRSNGRLVEHREKGPTECPSERYAGLWTELEDDDMDPLHLEMLRHCADLFGARPFVGTSNADLDRVVQLREMNAAGMDFPASLDNLNEATHAGFEVQGQKIDDVATGFIEHIDEHPGTSGGLVWISGNVLLEPPREEDPPE